MSSATARTRRLSVKTVMSAISVYRGALISMRACSLTEGSTLLRSGRARPCRTRAARPDARGRLRHRGVQVRDASAFSRDAAVLGEEDGAPPSGHDDPFHGGQ